MEPTLGRLARWLRLLGFDAPDQTGRWQRPPPGDYLLTRRQSLRGVQGALFLESDHLAEQLRQVISRLGLKPDPAKFFSRCLDCNLPVEPVSRDELQGLVPEYTLHTAASFSRCPGCGKIYWPGSHGQRAERLLAEMLAGRNLEG